MAVWGIGAFYKGAQTEDKTNDFINNNCACIGWNEESAPALHYMFNSIKIGDIVYIKSFTPKTKELHIKVIGIVKNASKNQYENFGTGVSVIWKENFELFSVQIDDTMYKINVFNNTLYEEYNKDILDKIIKTILD